ncbi:hypothetical protein YC2023_038127 [Brassica napus]
MKIHILNKKKNARGRFALKSMGTKDARVDVMLNKQTWSRSSYELEAHEYTIKCKLVLESQYRAYVFGGITISLEDINKSIKFFFFEHMLIKYTRDCYPRQGVEFLHFNLFLSLPY